MKCQSQDGAERDVERSKGELEGRLVDRRQAWNGGSKHRKLGTEWSNKEAKRRGRWLRDLAGLHHTPGTLHMDGMSSGYGDSLLC